MVGGLLSFWSCGTGAQSSPEPSSSVASVSFAAQVEPQSQEESEALQSSSEDSAVSSSSSEWESWQTPTSLFKDTVFIGDSITLKLRYYTEQHREAQPDFLDNAQFLVSGALGSGNALWELSKESVHPSFMGQKMLLEDAVAASGAQKVFVMLGMNDIGLYGPEQSAQNLMELTTRIVEGSPDCTIYIQSVTPMLQGKEMKELNIATIQEYNALVENWCQEQGYSYLDIYTLLADEEGFLYPEYCSDPTGAEAQGIHLTDEACQVWLTYLCDFLTAEQEAVQEEEGALGETSEGDITDAGIDAAAEGTVSQE